MDLQNTFYLMAIIFMSLLIIITLAVAVILFYIMKKIADVQKAIDKQIDRLNRFTADPADTAANIGAAVANTAINQVKRMIKKK